MMFEKQPVVLISTQRSGTNLFRDLLVSSKKFTDFREVFEEKRLEANTHYFNYRKRQFENNLCLSYPTTDNQIYLFEGFLKHLAKQTKTDFFVIDVKYNSCCHFTPFWSSPIGQPLFISLVKKYKLPVIHLIRENVLETECSSLLYIKNRKATVKKNQGVKHVKLTLECKNIVDKLKFRINEINEFKKYFKYYSRVCSIQYSEILEDNLLSNSIKKQLLNLLNLNIQQPIKSQYKKIALPLKETIINYKEIEEALNLNNLGYLLNSTIESKK